MKESPFSLKDKKILVTGASSGIGRQIAISVSETKANILITGRIEAKLLETASMMECAPEIVAADLTNTDSLSALVDKCSELDGIVVASGIMQIELIKFLTIEKLQRMLDSNFTTAANLAISLIKKKKIKKGASIIFITSVNGPVIANVAHTAYAASKGALTAFAKAMALDLAPQKIRVNCVAPGMIYTERSNEVYAKLGESAITMDKRRYPLGDYGEPFDVAYGVVYLLSDASKWITGTSLVIDGGLTAQ